ncbi:hypothetical protein BU17DRAFT_96873 [Hysterangium stoloniferum]|nr:hypothetical protein BU17DRAFT_96873 [Hysterangium stoloniferum]
MSKTASRWIPLEASPETFSSWASAAGLVTASADFYDVYGLDPELLMMVPKPVKAVVFLFPINETTEAKRGEEDEQIKAGDQTETDPTVLFIKQTIPNACGTIGLLHAITNSDITIAPESPLAKFIEQAIPLTPERRADLLANTELFASIHASTARAGQSNVPDNLDTDLHFCAFVQALRPSDKELRLIELDGRRAGPLDRGPSKDLLADVAKVVREYYIKGSDSLNFNLIALASPDSEE